MTLPLKPPLDPQLARPRAGLPVGERWAYEPKYDGFRAIVFVDGETATIQSRSGKPLARYFPELGFAPGHYVLDGEIVIDGPDDGQDFDALQQRIHPAQSRIAMLAEQTPSRYVAFDLLALDGEPWLERPFEERRAALERLVQERLGEDAATVSDSHHPPVAITPLTRDPSVAEPWLDRGEGVVAKDLGLPTAPAKEPGW